VRVFSFEDRVQSNGKTSDHVGREIVVDQALPVSAPGEIGSNWRQFVLPESRRLDDLWVVARAPRDGTKRTLKTVRADLREATPVTPSIWGSIKGGYLRR
jgi:hypothetical protein